MFTSLILNKYVIIGILLFSIVGGIFWYGYHSASVKYQEAEQQIEANEKLQQVLIEQRDEQHVEVKTQEVTKIKTVIQKVNVDVERLVDRPIYHNVCLDDAGLRAANEALTAATASPDTVSKVPTTNSAH